MELSEVEELAVLLREHPISEIEVDRQGSRLHLRKGAVAFAAPAPAAAPTSEAAAEPASAPAAQPAADAVILSSLMVGHFHHVDPPVRVGTTIKEGQVVGNVEAMKLMNEVVAETAGQVVEVLVEDGEPVDYGRQLFRIVRL